MDDLEEEGIDNDEYVSTDNLDYYVPMTEEEREMYEHASLREQAENY